MKKILLFVVVVLLWGCKDKTPVTTATPIPENKILGLDEARAKIIFTLPTHCLTVEYPNKLGQTIGSAADLKTPKELRPVFYGCFDWHSSVHGYWSIVVLLKQFPQLDTDGAIRKVLNEHMTPENMAVEMAFFKDKNNQSFERTYGWAWLFKLQEALDSWEDADAKRWAAILQPLTDLLIQRYTEYLPKLNYPIRTGTHDNSAFGLSLSLDYARSAKNTFFENNITTHAKRLFEKDKNCSLTYEPSGHDFLSPCLEEAYLMSKVLEEKMYESWLTGFLPELNQSDFVWKPGEVSDRTDGHLVHLDGLNFSRAACLYGIARKLPRLSHLNNLADLHFTHSFKNISNDDYMGSHWLGTFALYALQHKN